MNLTNSQAIPAPPNLVRSLLAGFDVVANHLGLVFFSIGLDLLLWFGPQIRLQKLFESYLEYTMRITTAQAPQLAETFQSSQEILLAFAQRFNLISALRTFPLGIASLMVRRSPLENPISQLQTIEPQSFVSAFLIWLILSVIGLFAGVLYFSLVCQAALSGNLSLSDAMHRWLYQTGQIFLLTLFLLVLGILVMMPLSCILPFLATSSGLGRFAIFMYGVVLLWLFFPLVFSPLGIFSHQESVLKSVRHSTQIVRATMLTTSLFILIIFVISQGLDILWNIPKEASWFSLIGVLGHAFIATSLLAAAFVYYRDAGAYVQKRMQLRQVLT
jgi:hypothetical protein